MSKFFRLHYRFVTRFGFVILTGLCAVPEIAGQSQKTHRDHSSAPATGSPPARRACACPDGRQFSLGASLFGKNSARVVITGFRPDPTPTPSAEQPIPCHDLTVLGQVIRLKTVGDRPFFQRESLKRGTIQNVCQTKIQFAEPKKFYDFFADDGSAVTLDDTDTAPMPPSEDQKTSTGEEQTSEVSSDLTGQDLIRLIPREQAADDPGASAFNEEDLKEGAYCIVRRQLKALPAVDEDGANVMQTGSTGLQRGPLTVWAGTLGRLQKQAGFRSEPLWIVELLPHSAPLSFSRSLGLLIESLHKNHPVARKFVLPSSDIVEINHFFDQYGVEWTRFGVESDDAQARESLGTTVLPDIYNPPELSLEQNLRNAQRTKAYEAVQGSALQLVFVPKNPAIFNHPNTFILDGEMGLKPDVPVAPHFFRQQCFLGASKTGVAVSPVLRVSDVDIQVFQPRESAQVPDDYYAIDFKLRLKSDSGGSDFPVVCRFPGAVIDSSLVGKAERILSSQFEIRKRETR
ncbi:MAG: hypothetical protein JO182_31085 [Acidobacteriaceae bacterium]|nr:hypothetical protein [Acidobacteriaceae bacterium]